MLFYDVSFSFSWLLTYTFLIPAAIAQIFISIAELLIPTRIPWKEAKAEMEIHLLSVKAKRRKCSYNLELYKPFYAF